MAKATFAPRGWGVCERECAGSGACAAQRVAGDWLGAGLAVGVGNRPERSGAMGVRRARAPGMSVGGLAGRRSGRAGLLGVAGERAGWG